MITRTRREAEAFEAGREVGREFAAAAVIIAAAAGALSGTSLILALHFALHIL